MNYYKEGEEENNKRNKNEERMEDQSTTTTANGYIKRKPHQDNILHRLSASFNCFLSRATPVCTKKRNSRCFLNLFRYVSQQHRIYSFLFAVS